MEKEKAMAKQVAYDAGMNKATKSLTAQLRDIALVFCLEVWGQALTPAGVSTESVLWASTTTKWKKKKKKNPPPVEVVEVVAEEGVAEGILLKQKKK